MCSLLLFLAIFRLSDEEARRARQLSSHTSNNTRSTSEEDTQGTRNAPAMFSLSCSTDDTACTAIGHSNLRIPHFRNLYRSLNDKNVLFESLFTHILDTCAEEMVGASSWEI